MPADRIITVNVQAEPKRNQYGETVPGPVTPLRVWASKEDIGLRDILETGGDRQEVQRRWTVRYDQRIYSSPTALLSVLDGGTTFNVQSVNEVTRQRAGLADLRKRFITITGVYVS